MGISKRSYLKWPLKYENVLNIIINQIRKLKINSEILIYTYQSAHMKKTNNSKNWEEYRTMEALLCHTCDCKLVKSLRKTVWYYLLKCRYGCLRTLPS